MEEEKMFVPPPPKELRHDKSTDLRDGKSDFQEEKKQDSAPKGETKVQVIEKSSKPKIEVIDSIINWAGLLISFGLLAMFVAFLFVF